MTQASSARAAELTAAALRQHQAGRLAEAGALYRQVLALDPAHPDGLHGLGVIAYQTGDLERAAPLLRQAVEREEVPSFLTNLGAVLHDLGRFEEAVAAYRRAIVLMPRFPAAHNNLGNALQSIEDLEGAEAAYRQALALQPDYPDTLINLGGLLQRRAKLDEAAAAFARAAAVQPTNPHAHFHLGLVLQEKGDLDGAAGAYQRAAGLAPKQANAHLNLGTVLRRRGRLAEAEAAYQRALALEPESADILKGLSLVQQDRGRLPEAEATLRRALAGAPDDPEALNSLGIVLQHQGRLGDAIAAYDAALAVRPDYAEAHGNKAGALQDQGRPDAAAEHYDRALALDPSLAEAASNRLFSLAYASDRTDAALFEAHRAWGQGRAAPAPAAHPNGRDPDRRLRVGLVSGDFRGHSVAYFLEPLLRARDRAAVEVFCYAQTPRPDRVTERLMGLADHWRFTVGLTDEAVAERVRADRIDILVDLAGHTAGARLGVFALKPAPVQATWLGYPNTTGLPAIDHRLVDAITDPPGPADALATEALVRLEGGFLCYGPPADAPAVAPPPSAKGAPLTFGSFNNPAKLSDATVATWSALLARLPLARLKLKGMAFADEGARDTCLARFAAHGIEAGRLDLSGWKADLGSHLAAYGEVDIALDPFPYNGTTTTVEALWMGVPVVCLMGRRHSGRVSASLLTRAGLGELVAQDESQYVEIAAALAADEVRLAALRSELRPRLAASPVCDEAAFARSFEAGLRAMWRRWATADQ